MSTFKDVYTGKAKLKKDPAKVAAIEQYNKEAKAKRTQIAADAAKRLAAKKVNNNHIYRQSSPSKARRSSGSRDMLDACYTGFKGLFIAAIYFISAIFMLFILLSIVMLMIAIAVGLLTFLSPILIPMYFIGLIGIVIRIFYNNDK